MIASADRIAEFRRLHASGCFVMPNPWDVGSARALASMGFRALATTSAGFAWTVGQPDNSIGLDQTLAHLRSVARSPFIFELVSDVERADIGCLGVGAGLRRRPCAR